MIIDSVFFPLSEFSSQESTIIPEKQIKQQLTKLENSAIALFTNSYNKYIDNAVEEILRVDDSIKAINNYKWSFKNEFTKNLWGEWLLGLGKGDRHGKLEITKSSTTKTFSELENIAIFREAESAVIRNIPAEKAIRERNNQLASDVSDSEWLEIKTALLDAIKPVSPTESPISRAELIKRINKALGDKKDRFRDRAESIARTELTFAYNAGRLNSYIQSGLVEAIKFISILDGRRCSQCESRHGLIVSLDDVGEIARIMPPIHPKCRCVISPVLKSEYRLESKKKSRQVKNRQIVTKTVPWAMAGILAAILLGRKTPIGTAIKISEQVKDIGQIAIAKTIADATAEEVKKPIPLSENIDLQTATFEQLRSLFTKRELSDKQIKEILAYREKIGLNSIDDLKKILEADKKAVTEVKDKNQAILEKLKEPEPVKVGQGGAIIPTKPRAQPTPIQQQAIATRGARLSGINSTLANTEGEISLLRSRIELDIRNQQQRLGLQETINSSNSGVTAVQGISQELIADISGLNSQIAPLQLRIKDLETKLAALLDPNVDDYFQVSPSVITSVKSEIQNLRGQLNQVNSFVSTQNRGASKRAKLLKSGQTQLKNNLPDYSESVSFIQEQLQLVAQQLDQESIAKSDTAISALRAKYRDLNLQLQSIKALRKQPFRQYSGDKKAISAYLGQVKGKSRNLSSRLSNLETRIDNLPKRVTELSPTVRKSYRKLQTALTTAPDYQPPIRTAPGVQGQQARLAKASRLQRQATIDSQFNSITAIADELVVAADDDFLNKKSWKSKPIKNQIESTVTKYESYNDQGNAIQQQLVVESRKYVTTIQNIDDRVNETVAKVFDDINNPLGETWFNSNNVISRKNRVSLGKLKRDITTDISNIDSRINGLNKLKKRVSSLKKDIQSIRSKTDKISITDKTRLDRQVELMLAELDGLTKVEVNRPYYNSQIKQYKQELESLLKGDSTLLKSPVKTNLNRIYTQVQELENRLTAINNAGELITLIQVKEQLKQKQKILTSLPNKVTDFPEYIRVKWQENRGVRQSLKQANKKLNTSISDYRKQAGTEIKKIRQLESKIDDATNDIIDSDIYRDNLDAAIKQQQDTIKIAIAQLDDNLKLIKLATNTEQGLQLVYADLKRIYDADVPGLAKITKDIFPVGLDEAVEVKRKVLKFLQDRGEQIQKRITLTLNSDKAHLATRYKLSVIENQIQQLEELRNSLVTSQKSRAVKIEKSLSELFQADPIFYKELNAVSILSEVQENTITQANIIKKQLTKLNKVKSELTKDLQQTLKYGIRDREFIQLKNSIPEKVNVPTQSLTKQQIAKELTKYNDSVTDLLKTRRSEFEKIGLFLKSNRVKLYGKNSISHNLKTNRKLTTGQQKAFDKLNPGQKELLIEASRTGVLDLYDDLYKLSLVKANLEDDVVENIDSIFAKLGLTDKKRIKKTSFKTKKYQEITSHLNRLRGMGYQGLTLEIGKERVKFIGMDTPPTSLAARQQWELLRKKLGVARDGQPLPISSIKPTAIANGTLTDFTDLTYNELLEAIAINRQLRYEINNRLSVFNFNSIEKNIRYFYANS